MMNGLCIQWGLAPAPDSGKTNVTFPVRYTAIPAIQVTTRGVSDTDYGESILGQVIGTVTGFVCDSNCGYKNTRIYWIAIGF